MMKKNILLVCGAGMSTSLLVKQMQDANIENDCNIKCCDTVSAHVLLIEHDIFLLAPHISYMKDEFLPLCKQAHIPFMVIDSQDYTKMDGKTVLNKVSILLEEYKKENPFKVVLLHSQSGAMSDLIVMDMKKKRLDDEKTWIIQSCDVERFRDDGKINVILLEPQICYEEASVKKNLISPLVVMDIPPRSLYATFDGRKILDYVHKIYNDTIKQEKEKVKKGLENI